MARCPTCKKTVDPKVSKYTPFCSERCKLIDLGRWFDGDFAVPGEPAEIPDAPPPDGDEGEER